MRPPALCLCAAAGLLIMLADVASAGRDFYKILGVARNANTNQIKKAYRKLAKELHPDKHDNDELAHERFSDLGNAYETLSDAEKRKVYDRHGEEGLQKMGPNGGGHGDPFSSFFGDFFGYGGGDREREADTPKGANVVVELWVTLEELYTGNFVEIARNKAIYKPASGFRKCNCRVEMRTQAIGPGRFQMYQERVCDECPNVQLVQEERLLEVEVEPGMVDGQQIPFVGEGEPHVDGEPGDLVLVVRTQKHARFERKADDLFCNVTVSLMDALTGFSMEVRHLDGHMVKVSREKVTWPGARIRKQHEGMPNFDDNNQRGIMIITFDVEFPRGELSDAERESFRALLTAAHAEPSVYNGLQGF